MGIQKPLQANSGFTVVELIIVIIILGIIGLSASSRFIGASSFSAPVAQEQAISIIRQIQLASMHSNYDVTTPEDQCRQLDVTLNRLGRPAGCGGANTFSDVLISDDLKGATFSVTNGPIPASIRFDLLGRPINSAETARVCNNDPTDPITSACRITMTAATGGESASVCINNEGFIYACN